MSKTLFNRCFGVGILAVVGCGGEVADSTVSSPACVPDRWQVAAVTLTRELGSPRGSQTLHWGIGNDQLVRGDVRCVKDSDKNGGAVVVPAVNSTDPPRSSGSVSVDLPHGQVYCCQLAGTGARNASLASNWLPVD